MGVLRMMSCSAAHRMMRVVVMSPVLLALVSVVTMASADEAGGFDWTQCKSEGGSKNCALCSDQEGGMLPCKKVLPYDVTSHWNHKKVRRGNEISECPDDKMAVKRKFWYVHRSAHNNYKATGTCVDMNSFVTMVGDPLTVWGAFPGLGKKSM